MVQLQTYQDTASYSNQQAMRIVNTQNKQASAFYNFLLVATRDWWQLCRSSRNLQNRAIYSDALHSFDLYQRVWSRKPLSLLQLSISHISDMSSLLKMLLL